MNRKEDSVGNIEVGERTSIELQRATGESFVISVQRSCDSNSTMPMPVASIINSFERDGIVYCYWKSSRYLQSVLAGDGDIDLLIDNSDQHHAETKLLKSDFKRIPSVPHRDQPSISSFLGFDELSGRLIHLHIHYRLIIGERLYKNYRIPWEHKLLARAIVHPSAPIRILDPYSEALLLVVRSCLELRWTDPVTVRHWRRSVSKFAADRAHLAGFVEAGDSPLISGRVDGRGVGGARRRFHIRENVV